MEQPESSRPVRGKRKEILFFVLPNLFTTANLFFGYFSILSSIRGRWGTAAFAIFLCAIADALDGRVARLTKSQSAFGEQYDSMADLVSFGAAPAMLFYLWALQPFGLWGWVGSFIYLVCAALRLARFNVLKQSAEKRFFQGLPSPAAAGTLASAVLFWETLGFEGDKKVPFMLAVVIFTGLAMVSSLPFRSFKDLKFRSQKTFAYVLLFALVLMVFAPEPDQIFFPIAAMYTIGTPFISSLRWIYQRLVRSRLKYRNPKKTQS